MPTKNQSIQKEFIWVSLLAIVSSILCFLVIYDFVNPINNEERWSDAQRAILSLCSIICFLILFLYIITYHIKNIRNSQSLSRLQFHAEHQLIGFLYQTEEHMIINPGKGFLQFVRMEHSTNEKLSPSLFGLAFEQALKQMSTQLFSGKMVHEKEVVLLTPNSGSRYAVLQVSALKTTNANLLYFYVTDITGYRNTIQQLQTEVERIQQNEIGKISDAFIQGQLYLSLLNQSQEAFIVADAERNIQFYTEVLMDLTGFNAEELNEISLLRLIHPDDFFVFNKSSKIAFEQQTSEHIGEFRIRHKNGHSVHVQIRFLFSGNNDPDTLILSLSDISERMLSEENISISNMLYQTIASNIPGSVIILLDEEEQCVLAKGDLLPLIGMEVSQIRYQKLMQIDLFSNNKGIQDLLHQMRRGNSFETETELNGNMFYARIVPLRRDTGKQFAGLLIMTDITEIKQVQNELNILNKNLEQKVDERTQQLETINAELESFTYSVSHDLRAPVRAIVGYARILEEDFMPNLSEDIQLLLTKIRKNAIQMGDMIESLMHFSKLGKREVSKSNVIVNSVIQRCLENLLVPDKFRIEIQPLENAYADEQLLYHVFYNLISNAIKFSSKEEQPKIQIWSERFSTNTLYAIRDNGVGFDMRYSQKLFAVFQRMHSDADFEGTGVGLAIVHRIITRHGGKIWSESEIGHGATFYFSLPNIETVS